jgi:hypothetical protein
VVVIDSLIKDIDTKLGDPNFNVFYRKNRAATMRDAQSPLSFCLMEPTIRRG